MSVLIRGVALPKEGFVEILIRSDGTAQQTGQGNRIDGIDYYAPYVGEVPALYEAVPVQAHGRLIDASALVQNIRDAIHYDASRGREYISAEDLHEELTNAPTIIPAGEDET